MFGKGERWGREGERRGDVLLGCHMGVSNFIFGGSNGYSRGNETRALKNPPGSYN